MRTRPGPDPARLRAALDRVADRVVAAPLLEAWGEAASEAARRIRRAERGGAAGPGLSRAAAVIASARVASSAEAATRALRAAGRDAAAEGARSMVEALSALGLGAAGGARETRAAAEARAASLAAERPRAVAGVFSRIAGIVSEAILAAPEGGAAEAAEAAFDGARWVVERLAQTEAALAFNHGGLDAAWLAARWERRVLLRWTERIDDAGKALDDRVAPDSFAMHGQLAPPGGEFRMPEDAPGVSPSLRGRAWKCPPNRPNDRAVLAPWLPGGAPGWVLDRDGRRRAR